VPPEVGTLSPLHVGDPPLLVKDRRGVLDRRPRAVVDRRHRAPVIVGRQVTAAENGRSPRVEHRLDAIQESV
jgi:hypothetical protein